MPLYDFQCEKCGKEFEEFASIDQMREVKCPSCKGKTKILITNSRSEHWFKPHLNEEFTGEPIYVETLGQYKDLCRKHNVVSRATGDVRNYQDMENARAARQFQ